MPLRNPLSALLDYASQRGNEASSIGSVMTQLARPILVSQGVETGATPPAPQAKTGGGVPATPLPQTTSDAQEYYIREIQKRGMSRPVSEGIVAGMGSESGLDPTINERDPVVPGSRGGFGLYQLTGPRRIAFERYAAENGKNVNDEQAQIDFMMSEFAGPERAAYDALIQSPDAQSAATVFTDQFLRPGVSHSAQSANEAARMSGQPFDPAMAGAGMNIGTSTMGGPDAAAGGALPQTVESILSSLYPTAAEDEKAAHRKDIWRGLSQGLSALSQGGQVDLSNIAANADQRRRQNVLDMRERERARAAASLVYGQTGDTAMAGAIASGAISYGDVVSERERKRVEQAADAQRLKQEQATGAAADLVAGMLPDLGFNEKTGAAALAAIKGGADITSVLNLGQQAQVADAARKAEETKATEAERRTAAVEHLLTSQNPIEKTAASYMQLDPTLSLNDSLKAAQEANKTETGVAPTADMQNAKALVASGAINPATQKPFTEAEAFAAITLPTPAGTEMTTAQKEAQQLFDTKATNPDTQKPFASPGEALTWRLGSGGAKTSVEVNTGSTGQVVPSAWADAEKALVENGQMFARATNPETGQLDIVLNPDGTPKIINIEGGEAASKTRADEAAAQAEAEKATLRAVQTTQSADTILRYGKDILNMTADWQTGVGQGLYTTLAGFIPQSITSEVQNRVDTIKNMTALDNLTAMRQASPTGGALGNVSDTEGKRLEGKFGALAVTGDPTILREDVHAAMNAYLDTVHGTPEQILKLYKEGKISAEDADAFSARYVIRGAGVDPEQERLGTLSNLGLSGITTTVLGDLTDQDIAPTAIKELGPDFNKIIQDDTFFDENGAFDTLSPTAQAEVKRLMGVK
jgi:hypothetical protein